MPLDFAKVTEFFFDRDAVVDAVEKPTLVRLRKFGGAVRKRARFSIRYRKAAAAAGAPPSAHRTGLRKKVNKKTGAVKVQGSSPLRDWILFAFDPQSKSVVIGPVPVGGKAGPHALKALEQGGPSTRKVRGKTVAIDVSPHPFMQPAFDAELPKVAESFRNMVK